MFARFLLSLVLGLAATSAAMAEKRLVVEETFLPVEIKGVPFRLEALVVKEAGATAKLPVAIITHGQPAESEQREAITARGWISVARDFARRGYLAVMVVRRGFGRSEGKAPFYLRGCRDGDFGSMLEDQADDIEAAVQALGQRSDADLQRIVAWGGSVGGAVVLNLASRKIDGLRAVISISGGVRPLPSPGQTCKPEDLVPLYGRYGESNRVPTLWLYSQNDSLFPANYARELHEAFAAKGGRSEFHMFEPIGKDGHDLVFNLEGSLRSTPAIDNFLRTLQMPTFDPAPLDAAVREISNTPTARRILRDYLACPTEKALVVSVSHKRMDMRCRGSDLDAVAAKALEECAALANEPCRVVARNFEVVKASPVAQAPASATADVVIP